MACSEGKKNLQQMFKPNKIANTLDGILRKNITLNNSHSLKIFWKYWILKSTYKYKTITSYPIIFIQRKPLH